MRMRTSVFCLLLIFLPSFHSNRPDAQRGRVARDVDDDTLARILEKMKKLARLLSAIHVHRDLLDKKNETDEAIGDLLHLGNVTPKDIISMDGLQLQAAIREMKELPVVLREDVACSDINETLKRMEELRTVVFDTNKGMGWPDREAVEEDMMVLREHGPNVTLDRDAFKLMNDWKTIVEGMRAGGKEPNETIQSLNETVDGLLRLYTATLEPGKTLAYPTIHSMYRSIKYVRNALISVKVIAYHGEYLKTSPETDQYAKHDENRKTLLNVSRTLDQVYLQFTQLNTVARSLTKPPAFDIRYQGLPNGFRDIPTLLYDLEWDAWIDTQFPAERMLLIMEGIRPIFDKFNETSLVFGTPDEEFRLRMAILYEHINEIRAVTTLLDGFWKCHESLSEFDQSPNLGSLPIFTSAENMDAVMEDLKKKTRKFQEWATNHPHLYENLTTVKALCVIGNETENADTIAALNASKTVDEVSRALDGSMNVFGEIEAPWNKSKQSAQAVLDELPDLINGIIPLAAFGPSVKCLNAFPAPVADVLEATLKRVEGLRTSHAPWGAWKTINVILNSTDALKRLQFYTQFNITNSSLSSRARHYLRTLPNLANNSRILGAAVRGAEKLRQLYYTPEVYWLANTTSEVSRLLEQGERAATAEDHANLEAVVALRKQMRHFTDELRTWGRYATYETNFMPALARIPLFTYAKDVPSVSGDLWAMSKSVARFAAQFNDTDTRKALAEDVHRLVVCADIGLDLAEYAPYWTMLKDPLEKFDAYLEKLPELPYPSIHIWGVILPPVSLRSRSGLHFNLQMSSRQVESSGTPWTIVYVLGVFTAVLHLMGPLYNWSRLKPQKACDQVTRHKKTHKKKGTHGTTKRRTKHRKKKHHKKTKKRSKPTPLSEVDPAAPFLDDPNDPFKKADLVQPGGAAKSGAPPPTKPPLTPAKSDAPPKPAAPSKSSKAPAKPKAAAKADASAKGPSKPAAPSKSTKKASNSTKKASKSTKKAADSKSKKKKAPQK